jgi:hypothetical protein
MAQYTPHGCKTNGYSCYFLPILADFLLRTRGRAARGLFWRSKAVKWNGFSPRRRAWLQLGLIATATRPPCGFQVGGVAALSAALPPAIRQHIGDDCVQSNPRLESGRLPQLAQARGEW